MAGLLAAATLTLASPVAAAAHHHPSILLRGTFRLAPGACQGYQVTGSYFRLSFPGATPARPRYFASADSTCDNATYTLLVPGTQGGLATGTFQPAPTPAFAADGAALAARIAQPTPFAGLDLAVATARATRRTLVPAISDRRGVLTGQLAAWTADWDGLILDQGTPARPHSPSTLTGSYDAATAAFVLSWRSPVTTGRYAGFTGVWHLTGTFTPDR
jgi:hypothetical protein